MKKVNIKARIKRNMLAEISGKYFIDENSALVKILNNSGENALVGIQNENGIYTVIGFEKIYYSTLPGVKNEILINDFLNIITRQALNNGKSHNYEFINLKGDKYLWVMNIQTMNALWNTMLLFDTRAPKPDASMQR